MIELSLIKKNGYLFVELNRNLWLIDTGSPLSFGNYQTLIIADRTFNIKHSHMTLSATTISEAISIDCMGLLGVDVLNEFDCIFDVTNQCLQISSIELTHEGLIQKLDNFMKVPIIQGEVANHGCRLFLDTGSEISYLHHPPIHHFAKMDQFSDFYPGFGNFKTETYAVEFSLENNNYTLRCGTLPDLLATTLMLSGTQGIIGNEILLNRSVGYFPRRKILCL